MRQDVFSLLVKKLSGELNLVQRIFVNTLLIFSPKIRKEYHNLREIWQRLDYENPHKLNITVPPVVSRWPAYVKLAIVASIAIFIGLYALLNPKTYVIRNTSSHIQTVKLPDSSTVILDTGAILTYKVGKIKGFDRQVRIIGQAFFEITKVNGESFVVRTPNLDVKVLGTKFNVLTDRSFTQVTLVEGKIKLLDFKGLDTSVILTPQHTAVYSATRKKLILKKTNTNIQTFWLNNKIEFQNYNLQDIANILRIYYGKYLVFDDSLTKYKRIGGSAPTDNYMLIVRALAYITHSDYVVKGDTIYLKHKKH